MVVQVTVKNKRVLFEGTGIDFLQLKADLASILGPDAVRTDNRSSFSLHESALPYVRDILETKSLDIHEEPVENVEQERQHAEARKTANSVIFGNAQGSLSETWNKILDPAQSVAVSAMITPGLAGLCLFDEQGIGKTVMTIATFDELYEREEVEKLVIIAPVTMMQGWADEINKFLPDKYNVVVLDGNRDAKRHKLLSPSDVIVCNFESLTSLLVPLKSMVKDKQVMLAVDESFNVKNKDAIRSESVRELRKYCSKGFVMCGTPAPNSPADVIHQFDVADNGYTFAGFKVPKDPVQLLDEISQRINDRGVYIRRLKTEVLPELPDKNFHIVKVDMVGRQAELYNDARNELEIELKSMDNVTFRRNLTTYFQQRLVMLQICACPQDVDPAYQNGSVKLNALDKIVEEKVVAQKKKLVIWSFYKTSLNEICSRYSNHQPVLLDGSVTGKQRAEAVKKFQDDPDTLICVANPAAAGAGVTLHAASDAVYISLSNQAAHFLQSIDRIHRRGQSADSVHYHIIVCAGTIEENEIKRLREKELLQQQLLHDKVSWPNSLDEALADLYT